MKQILSFIYPMRIAFSLCLIMAFAVPHAEAQTSKTEKSSSSNDLDDIPDKYIEEAWNFNKYCRSEVKLSDYQNCECLAALFLDKRIEVGPGAHSSSIMLAIEGQCPDATNAAGQVYTECLGDGPVMPSGVPLKKFCKCYASTYTKLFETVRAKPSSRTFVRLKTQAMTMCRDPALAQRIYPGSIGLLSK